MWGLYGGAPLVASTVLDNAMKGQQEVFYKDFGLLTPEGIIEAFRSANRCPICPLTLVGRLEDLGFESKFDLITKLETIRTEQFHSSIIIGVV